MVVHKVNLQSVTYWLFFLNIILSESKIECVDPSLLSFKKILYTSACHVSSQSIEELEKEMLNGQKLQGPATAAEVYLILKHKKLIDK